LIIALCTIAIGLLGGSTGALVGLLSAAGDGLSLVTVSASFLILGTILGLILAWHALQAIQGRPSAPFRPRAVLVLLPVFLAIVGLGQITLAWDLAPMVLFPIFHVAATVLPSIIILGLVGKGLRGAVTWRELVFQTSSGALLSTVLAFVLEAILLFALAAATLAGVLIRPGGTDLVLRLAMSLEEPTWAQDPAVFYSAFTSPAVVFGGLVVLAVAIPMIEEGIKTVGIGLLAYRRPGLAQALLWGLASACGFALVEATLNTASGLQAWAPLILLRSGATLMHCFTGALMGIAWHGILSKRHWARGLALYALSVSVHALWNGSAAWMGLASLKTLGSDGPRSALAMLGASVALSLLVLLALAAGLGLVALTRHVLGRNH
jgi:hypothetical protein